MSFLPVVQRELLAAARRRSTFTIRWWAALVAIGATLLFLLLASLAPGQGTLGRTLFSGLTTYAFGLALLAGVLLTADCLSQEKREGTLGLLFLTELKGYDVVLGKFTALSLNAFYCVLAFLPATALPFLLGGVTGGEFSRASLAIVNALFFSLAAGMVISSFARDSAAAMGATSALLLVFSALAVISKLSPVHSWISMVQYFSPVTPLLLGADRIYTLRPHAYWAALALSSGVGCVFLALASVQLPKLWQESGTVRHAPIWRLLARSTTETPSERARWLDQNPVLWLTKDDLALRWSAWGSVVILGLLSLGLGSYGGPAAFLSQYGLSACGFLLKCLVALQTCRFFAEGRRTGMLELLLSTPIPQTEILRGQSLAFRRIFLGPIVAFLILSLTPAVLEAIPRLGGGASASLNAGFGLLMGFVMSGSLALSMIADVFAVVWFGRWLALSSARPSLATPMTILWVLILPTFAICGLYLVVDLVLVLYASAKLKRDFRASLSRTPPGRTLG